MASKLIVSSCFQRTFRFRSHFIARCYVSLFVLYMSINIMCWFPQNQRLKSVKLNIGYISMEKSREKKKNDICKSIFVLRMNIETRFI